MILDTVIWFSWGSMPLSKVILLQTSSFKFSHSWLIFIARARGLTITVYETKLIGGNGEGASSAGFPKVFNILIRLGADGDLLSEEIGGVETNTELTNHTDISTSRDGFHEGLGSGLGNCSEVTNKVGLGHTATGIFNGEGVVGLVGDNSDSEFGSSLGVLGLGNTLVADFIEGI